MKIILVLLLFLNFYINCRKLDFNFKRCDVRKENFNKCLSEAIPNAIKQLRKPIPRMGLPSMNPLVIPAISISPGPGAIGFQQNYTNFKVWGFMEIQCPETKLDLEAHNMSIKCKTNQIRVETNYNFNGSIAVMDFYGDGNGTVLLDGVNCYHTYRFEEYYKKANRHLRVINSSLEINPNKVTFRFDNLYDGNPILSKNINQVLNDNWREVYTNLKADYEEAFRRVFQALFNSLLARVPVSNIFINS